MVKHFPLTIALIAAAWSLVGAQEMEPNAYSRAPVGAQVVLLTYAFQSGDILTDSALPLTDVSVNLHAGSVVYGRTFGLAGRQASLGFFAPYVKGNVRGTVFETEQEVTRSGLGDLRLRFVMNLIGSPALSPAKFVARKPKTVVGASISVVVPTGQYDPNRLVNISSNRWAVKPEIGISKPAGRWTVEGAAGVWLYTTNNNFFGGSRREQKPLLSLQGDVVYTFRPRMWLSGNGVYFTGGRTTVNGVVNSDRQANTRVGATFSYPLNRQQSLKVAVAKGVTTRFGGDIKTVVVGWQYSWF